MVLKGTLRASAFDWDGTKPWGNAKEEGKREKKVAVGKVREQAWHIRD